MTAQEILKDNSKIKSYANECSGWFAVSRDGINIITFSKGEENECRFYKNQKSWAIRVSQLIRTGK